MEERCRFSHPRQRPIFNWNTFLFRFPRRLFLVLKGVTTDNDGFEFLPIRTYSSRSISNRGKAKRNIAFISL